MMKRLTALFLCLLMVLAMAGCTGEKNTEKKPAAPTEPEAPVTAYHTNAHGYESWTIHYGMDEAGQVNKYYYLDESGTELVMEAETLEQLMDKPVLVCGDQVLTNRVLQYHYVDRVYNLSMNYGEMLGYMMDTSAPLDSQLNSTYGDGTATWQKTMLDEIMIACTEDLALLQQAQEEGFVLTADQEMEISMYSDMEQAAMMYGLTSGLELVRAMYGPAATTESYATYVRQTQTARYYREYLSQSIELTEEDISAHYDDNAEYYAERSVLKDETRLIDVRHILIQPQAAEDGTIPEDAWLAAEAEANRILAEFKSGARTEEAFGELAGTYSTDTGSAYNGGLYEGVAPGQMVPNFNDWCFDASRKTGDTGVVRTDYGYHIMYFVAHGEQIHWKLVCEEDLREELVTAMVEEIVAKWGVTENRDDAALLDGAAATKPSA